MESTRANQYCHLEAKFLFRDISQSRHLGLLPSGHEFSQFGVDCDETIVECLKHSRTELAFFGPGVIELFRRDLKQVVRTSQEPQFFDPREIVIVMHDLFSLQVKSLYLRFQTDQFHSKTDNVVLRTWLLLFPINYFLNTLFQCGLLIQKGRQ